MLEIIQFMFSGFWIWVGFFITSYLFLHYALKFLLKAWSRFLRHMNIRKHGWPPTHLDADGDWRPSSQ